MPSAEITASAAAYRHGTVIPPDQTICLCMIVRDEASVLPRCLASVRPLIDCFVIVDTGSTDDTIAVAWKALAGVPGMLVSRPWVDFGHNRSEALALARPHAAYSLIIDAGDELLIPIPWARPVLAADSYLVEVRDAAGVEPGTLLVSNAFVWRYVGVLYEVLNCAEARNVGHLPIGLHRHHDGRRRRDAATYRNDATVLAKALAAETDPYLAARYAFHLAQSYRDCGNREAAIDAYLHRATLGAFEQEVFVSLYEAARQMEALDRDIELILATYRRATEACPARAEAAHGASRLCRGHGRHAEGYAIAKAAIHLQVPANGLCVEPWIYRHGLLDEFAVNAYWSQHYEDCVAACVRLLALDDLSNDDRARFAGNMRFADDRIAELAARSRQPIPEPDGIDPAVEELRQRLGAPLDAVTLRANVYDGGAVEGRPLVLWMHDDITADSARWLLDRELVAEVDRFVFVSAWQMARFIEHFGLRSDRCLVLEPARDVPAFDRIWTPRLPFKVAYVGAPGDGLSVLLDALEHVGPIAVEVHIWLSPDAMGAGEAFDLRAHARNLANVECHGEPVSREALRDCDFLAYPSSREEVSCPDVVEAMANGCRVICPAHGALTDTVGFFGLTYPFTSHHDEHVARFAAVLLEDVGRPWGGDVSLALEQQRFVRAIHDWPVRISEWLALLDRLDRERLDRLGNADLERRNRRGIEALGHLRDRGFSPSGIIDAGAEDGAFARAARRVFPDAHILMIDAAAAHSPGLERVGREIYPASHVRASLGTRNRRARSFFGRARADAPDQPARQRTLRSLVAASGRSFQMLKVTVGGAELDVIEGLGSCLADIEVILVRMSLVAAKADDPLLDRTVAKLERKGFVLSDFIDEHRYREGSLLRIDGLFVRRQSRLRPRPPFT